MNEAWLPTLQRDAGGELDLWELSAREAARATDLAAELAGCLADERQDKEIFLTKHLHWVIAPYDLYRSARSGSKSVANCSDDTLKRQ